MRAVVCRGPRDYIVEQVDDPRAADDEAVLRVEAVGICASDVKCFQGAPMFWGDETRPRYVEPPVIPGHEFVGRVVQIGRTAAARWGVQEGDRVTVEQIVPCEQCWYCRRGFYWMCRQNDIFGFHQSVHGAMAEYIRVPSRARVHRISPDLPAGHAAFAEPLSCSLHAVERACIEFEDTVVIAGMGPIGLGMVAGARLRNPKHVVCVDSEPRRLDVARACGGDITLNFTETDPVAEVLDLTQGYGCDAYLDATGHPSGVIQGLTMLRKLGRFVEYSVMREPVTVDWTIIGDSKELDVRGAHLGPHAWPTAIRIIEEGLLPLQRIVTHELSIQDMEKGFDLVARGRDSIKVVLAGV